ncbi:MAG: hypothetical protein IIC25_08755, partial [Chloroflexi bacterium]|nr:hypothetical protein [Chloroflexota bacterium]
MTSLRGGTGTGKACILYVIMSRPRTRKHRLRIADSYSHMFGEAILDRLHGDLKEEVRRTITDTPIDPAKKLSREKTNRGQTAGTEPDFT